MFGAGGAARAVGVELALADAATITVVNRDPTRGQAVVDLINRRTSARADLVPWVGRYRVPEDTDIVVNATSIGLFPHVDATLDLDVETLKPDMVVADIIPNPPRTRLLADAGRRGLRIIDGLGMLVNQGVIGVKHWTGVDVDATVMRKTLTDLFGASALLR
jgi:shikimate dehydrogenase